jgi:hypothetical protein
MPRPPCPIPPHGEPSRRPIHFRAISTISPLQDHNGPVVVSHGALG